MVRNAFAMPVVLALALAGCGSTVPAGRQQSAGLAPEALSPSTSTGGPGGPLATGVTPGTAVGSPGGPGTAGGSSLPGAGGGGLPSGLPAAVSGRGFDAKHILLGYTTSRDANKGLQSLGFSVGVGDTDAQVHAIVDDLNAHGGIAGRHVDLVVHDFSFANYTRDEDTESQKACATFTEDRKPFAVLNTIGLGNGILATCLAKKDIPYIDNRFSMGRDPTVGAFRRSLYKPSSMSIDTYVPLFVNGLLRQGFFHEWDTAAGGPGAAPVKVGMMHFDTPDWDYYMKAVKKRLAAAGHPVAKEVTYAVGVDNVVAASSSAVLQFREAGITHVVNANIAFIEAAEQQHYRPRYSIDEGVGPGGLAQLAPKAQLHGSLGVGYNPFNDVEVGSDKADTNRRAPRACEAVMRGAGQDTSSETVLQMMMTECDLFTFVARSLGRVRAISTDALAAGANSLATDYESTITFGVQLDARHHAGAVAARNLAYVDDCSCYHYTGLPFRE